MKKQRQRTQIITPHGINSCVRLDGQPVVECTPERPDFHRARAQSAAGWMESGTYTPFEPAGCLSATWVVPEPPEVPDQSLIYMFCGLEDASLTTILQPVLQWGNNRLFGDAESWCIACWHCTPSGQTIVSTHRPKVRPGDILRAKINMETAHETTCDWLIEIGVEGDPSRRAELSVPGLDRLMLYLAGAALEAYSLPSGDPLPGTVDNLPLLPSSDSTEFSGIEVCDLNGDPIRTGWRATFPSDPRFDVDIGDDFTSITLVY